jgi:hypothetical protein
MTRNTATTDTETRTLYPEPKPEAEFTAHLVAELYEPMGATPYYIAKLAAWLMRQAHALESLAVADCNYGLDDRQARRLGKLKARVTAELAPHGITPLFSGDPRGAVLKLRMPSGRTNDWGQEGIIVP